jgi:hypothetical protein
MFLKLTLQVGANILNGKKFVFTSNSFQNKHKKHGLEKKGKEQNQGQTSPPSLQLHHNPMIQ